MDVRPLRYFVTLAKTRHFGRAATLLHLSQPALSRQLTKLEESIGVKLIERTSRSVVLTAAGERFYTDARSILASPEQAVSNAKAAAAGDEGTLTVGFTMCAAYSVMPRYASTFGALWPNVKLHLREVVSNNLTEQVLSGQIDVAIMFPGLVESGLMTRVVISEPLCVALSKAHPLAHANLLKIEQLAGEPFVLASEDVAASLRAAIIGHCRTHGFDPDIRFEVQLQQTVLSLVSEGVGLALVPSSMRKAQLDGVVYRPLANAPQVEQILAWSKTNHNPCLARFLETDYS